MKLLLLLKTLTKLIETNNFLTHQKLMDRTNNQEFAKVALKERCFGCFFGLIVGDAVGTTLEFTKRQPTNTLQDMEGGGPFRLEPGEWTDDASFEQPTPSYFHFGNFFHKKSLRFVFVWRVPFWTMASSHTWISSINI